MLKREKSFFHLSTMFIKEERKMFFFSYSLRSLRHDKERKFFFRLASSITTPWSREKKLFFSFSYQDHYAMIKREESFSHLATMFTNEERKTVYFVYSLWSLRHHQEQKFFFNLATTITTLWSREKTMFCSFSYYDHYAMIKREKVVFFI